MTMSKVKFLIIFFVAMLTLALSTSGCSNNGRLQKKLYLDSNNSNKAYLGYEFPIDK